MQKIFVSLISFYVRVFAVTGLYVITLSVKLYELEIKNRIFILFLLIKFVTYILFVQSVVIGTQNRCLLPFCGLFAKPLPSKTTVSVFLACARASSAVRTVLNRSMEPSFSFLRHEANIIIDIAIIIIVIILFIVISFLSRVGN